MSERLTFVFNEKNYMMHGIGGCNYNEPLIFQLRPGPDVTAVKCTQVFGCPDFIDMKVVVNGDVHHHYFSTYPSTFIVEEPKDPPLRGPKGHQATEDSPTSRILHSLAFAIEKECAREAGDIDLKQISGLIKLVKKIKKK